MRISTVKVVNGDGFRLVNQNEFDPQIHRLYKPEEKKAVVKAKTKAAKKTAIKKLKQSK